MQKLKIHILSIIFVSYTLSSFAQEAASQAKDNRNQSAASQGSLSSGTIASQFDYLEKISNNYQEYKVVRRANLEKIQRNIADSLNSIQTKLANANAILNNHDTEVASLKDSLKQIQLELKNTQEQKESLSLLGLQLSKTSYNTLMWSIVAILLALLVFYIYRFKQSHVLTAEAKRNLEETKEEFDQHRKRSMEREQKLNRRLQDELNKRI